MVHIKVQWCTISRKSILQSGDYFKQILRFIIVFRYKLRWKDDILMLIIIYNALKILIYSF